MKIKLTQKQFDVIEAAKKTKVQKTLKNGKHEYVDATQLEAQRALAKFYINNRFGSEILLSEVMAVYEGRAVAEIMEEG
ncbi:hypothetical protein ESZ50_01280 [Weissella muntiaci]|uniref:Uncharacterized protein n=1 Tax=Weissella muntiaci TaxID=2508881 RepID=A0A6C2CB48_9LACO|nr:hypothetical protein [Weissella muntiaci]TYC50876.1 hypothetical protein ESZ50_01280 [Weissella muntiaci]